MYYDDNKPDLVVSVLGTNYAIYMNVPDTEDETLKKCSGYCDKTTKRVIVAKISEDCNLGDSMEWVKYVLRHELIHAFLFESGIGGDTTWDIEGEEHPEHMVEWFGMQFPKLAKLFEEIGVL